MSPQGLTEVKLLCDNWGSESNLALFRVVWGKKKLTLALWFLLFTVHTALVLLITHVFIEHLLHARHHAVHWGVGGRGRGKAGHGSAARELLVKE